MYVRTFMAAVLGFMLSAMPSIAETMNASWYGVGDNTAGKPVAMPNAGPFDPYGFTAAHKTLPFGTRLMLTNPKTGHVACVTITDRGPYVKGRELDVSYAVAKKLGFVNAGTAKLTVVKNGC